MANNDVQDRREFLTCAVCVNIYETPKLLPCHHTFCQKCLQDLISHSHSGTFPCPMCRKQTTVPATGRASVFQDNYYILLQDLERARNWRLCLKHDKVLEFYCDDCSEAICVNCSLTEHKSHTAKDIGQAAQKAREDLLRDKFRLESAVLVLISGKVTGETTLLSLQQKGEELERQIRSRHSRIIQMADQCLKESLSSLETALGEAGKPVTADLQQIRKSIKELSSLVARVKQTLQGDESCELLTVAREMRYGKGGAQAVGRLTSCNVSKVTMPQVPLGLDDETLKKQIREHLGVGSR